MYLVAIDPGTNTTGVAVFFSGMLIDARSLTTKEKDRLDRQRDLLIQLRDYLLTFGQPLAPTVAIEDPLCRGHVQTIMQRFIGAVEGLFSCKVSIYVNPITLKKFCGDYQGSKQEVAAFVKRELPDYDIQSLIDKEEWDSTDAIAIGLYALAKLSGGTNEPIKKTKKTRRKHCGSHCNRRSIFTRRWE